MPLDQAAQFDARLAVPPETADQEQEEVLLDLAERLGPVGAGLFARTVRRIARVERTHGEEAALAIIDNLMRRLRDSSRA